MIDLKFININDPEDIEIDNISEIYLSDKNPRFTTTILDKNIIMKNFMFSKQTEQKQIHRCGEHFDIYQAEEVKKRKKWRRTNW